MKVIDPGHTYQLNCYDGGDPIILIFMKREGDGYPGNIGHYPGTNIQEVLRVLIDRIKYLQQQVYCEENTMIIEGLMDCIWLLEERAAQRHKVELVIPNIDEVGIENVPTCKTCGHMICNHKETE